MATERSKPAPRKPRADPQRNRERILEVAKDAFTRSNGEINLDDVAKQAGVGAGTLYRHFPTREALLEAVYRTEVETEHSRSCRPFSLTLYFSQALAFSCHPTTQRRDLQLPCSSRFLLQN
jgi:AcrR family transcriptional regulator